ncbi:hypothetical protein GGS23DRAFT_593980 [Durotheca rogersii]|uniref:uncharacterized protein n=1 Tax=Durotheca rogersii TaxID=419775 RepID=UPI00221F6BE7|nr:uncharacterized protein GGS23DRAFT_593980 [Durotheca rogersii]KAI5865808.1 hypothetical protein GGS23DRAFT_593980 [Durotheca rogersii]
MASSSFTFEVPSPPSLRGTRMRTRQVEGAAAASDDADSKGGRFLRKRARVDYTFDQPDDEENQNAKSAPITTRALKRRKTDVATIDADVEDEAEARSKRRASEQPQSSSSLSSSRRRNPSRKSTTVEPQPYVPEQQGDDVQDTIEVGGHQSDESDLSVHKRSSTGSHPGSEAPLRNVSNSFEASHPSPSSQTAQPPPSSPPSQSSQPSQPQTNNNPPIQEATKKPAERQEPQGEAKAPESSASHAQHHQVNGDSKDEDEPNSLEYLTPYIAGSRVYYPDYPETEPEPEPEPEPKLEAEVEAGPEAEPEADPEGEAEAEAEPEPADPEEEAEPDADAELEPDAANENGAEEAAGDDQPAADDQADGGAVVETDANSPSASAEAANANNLPVVKKKFAFKKTRQATDFTQLFTDVKSLSPNELHRRVEAATWALVAWQNEYNELRKVTDDYDNSVRYHKEEESFERRFNMAVGKNPAANPLRKEFVVKGIRAPKTEDPLVAYTRQQDRIMANVYGFEYDPRDDKMGQQDPIAQRTGLGRNGRLRERPRQTAKAAEADDPNIVQGKRTRKPPTAPDRGSTVSRGSTPAPTQRGRRRGNQAPAPDADAEQTQKPAAPNSVPEPADQEAPKKKGRGGRPRKNAITEPAPEIKPTPTAEEEQAEAGPELHPEPESKPQSKSGAKAGAKPQQKTRIRLESKPKPKPEPTPELTPKSKRAAGSVAEEEQPSRKRRRKAAEPTLTPTPLPADEGDAAANGTNLQAPTKVTPRKRASRKADNPSTSLNTTSSTAANQADEPRPLTASSTATVETVASNGYQLREKRQRKFTLDVNEEDGIGEPKTKRARRAAPKKTAKAEDIAPAPEPAPPAPRGSEAGSILKPHTIIKLKVPHPHNAARPTSTPTASGTPSLAPSSLSTASHVNHINGTNGNVLANGIHENGVVADGESGAVDPTKDYNSMTKSEKMSFSMKARWASGSMGTAVAKRRATLAAKKQSARTPAPNNAENQAPTAAYALENHRNHGPGGMGQL